ncbi:hypothetical protein BS78_07G082000 [Paspalum vaginatum]|nr:hypothetical protein BS78_07G082000 [Paspalum vaginatum]
MDIFALERVQLPAPLSLLLIALSYLSCSPCLSHSCSPCSPPRWRSPWQGCVRRQQSTRSPRPRRQHPAPAEEGHAGQVFQLFAERRAGLLKHRCQGSGVKKEEADWPSSRRSLPPTRVLTPPHRLRPVRWQPLPASRTGADRLAPPPSCAAVAPPCLPHALRWPFPLGRWWPLPAAFPMREVEDKGKKDISPTFPLPKSQKLLL